MKLLTSPFYYFCLRIVHLPAALSAHKLFITLPCRTLLPISALGLCWEKGEFLFVRRWWAKLCGYLPRVFKAITSNNAAEDKKSFLFIYRFTVWQKIFLALYFMTGVGWEIEEADCPSVLKQKEAQAWAKTSLHINKVKRKTLLVEIQDSVFFFRWPCFCWHFLLLSFQIFE